ncbi:type IV pilus modification protein PilV [Dyella amyloliquefaciens]|uniref:type IV pilus modification protein PilV n=1 Tax=Dyella amyloliquefaciens TaxID=1770545 RepID=UPI002D21B956|nr:type IV pilus modification protein PilV [Dyella amyloliquefaciens]
MTMRMQSARLGRRPGLLPGAVRQAGVGLIEVLIAVLVLSIGFIGMAALQARSLSTNNSAMARSMATVATYSILDAMRADLVNAKNGAYNSSATGAVVANACPAAAGTLVSVQINQWCKTDLAPLGVSADTTGTITCTPVTGTNTANCTIIVQFNDSRAALGGSQTQQVVTQAML